MTNPEKVLKKIFFRIKVILKICLIFKSLLYLWNIFFKCQKCQTNCLMFQISNKITIVIACWLYISIFKTEIASIREIFLKLRNSHKLWFNNVFLYFISYMSMKFAIELQSLFLWVTDFILCVFYHNNKLF